MATNIEVLIVLGASLVLGVILGYFYGAKKAGGNFYKYPSSHWRIRGR
jgi:hypothetical protein